VSLSDTPPLLSGLFGLVIKLDLDGLYSACEASGLRLFVYFLISCIDDNGYILSEDVTERICAMPRKIKLPPSLTLATTVLPPEQSEDIKNVDFMELVDRFNTVNRALGAEASSRGNGRPFREKRDILLRNLSLGKK
jgi:hypothetical protein